MSDKLVIGDMRSELAETLRKSLEQIINTHQHLDKYWILLHAKWNGDTLVSKLIIYPYKPIQMLATVCWEVNNRQGKLVRCWALPYDIPKPVADEETKIAEEISEEALNHYIHWN